LKKKGSLIRSAIPLHPPPFFGGEEKPNKKPVPQQVRNGNPLFRTFFIIVPPINKEEAVNQPRVFILGWKIIYFAGICQIEKDCGKRSKTRPSKRGRMWS
jgi:hypothetical protein